MFKPFHDITTQAVALTPIFCLNWLNYNRIECFLSQVDADGNGRADLEILLPGVNRFSGTNLLL